MDRRFICQRCTTKWFDQRAGDAPAPTACGACGGPLAPYEAPARPAWDVFADNYGDRPGPAPDDGD
jgi:hypothetical protein